MNLQELRAQTEVELEAAQNRQRKAKAEIQLILDTARQEGRANLTDEETQRSDQLFENIDLAKAQEKGIKDKLARLAQLEAEEREMDKRASEVTPTGATPARRTATVHVTREERTYRPDTDPTGRQFLQDVSRQFLYNDVQANSRLAQHMAEERVERAQYMQRADTTTANWSGLVVPQYLVDMVAPAVANLRPFADAATNKHPLPADGMSVNISRVTTPTAAGLQAGGEATAVPSQQIDDTLLTIPVQTAAGYENVSRQAIDRGNGIEDTVLQDLFSRYVTDLDNQLINQASTGLKAVAGAGISYTGTTGPAFYSAIQGAASQVEAAMLAMGQPSHVVMNSRRWYWLSAQTSAAWPMLNFQSPSNASNNAFGAANSNGYAQGLRGVLPNGLGVVVDNNIPTNVSTNQDLVFVVPQRECHLWEDPNAPAFIRAEQPNAAALGVLLVIYGYYAYSFQRYSGAIQMLTGTGLTTPTF